MGEASATSRSTHAAPAISVVVCTHNRATDLERALASVLVQKSDGFAYEIVVVDNCSTDATPQVVQRAADSGAPVRYVFESALGLCHARNAGWRAAKGTIVAYLDDDALAQPGWLAAIHAAFAAHPEAGVAGGRVDPIWEAERPSWLSDDVALSLTIVDWSDRPKLIEDVGMQWLVGANIALPRATLAEVGGFDPALDRVGNRMLSSGDVFLQKQVMRRGYGCLYDPAIHVHHKVPASRLKKEWFVNRYYWQGVSDAVMQLLEERLSFGARVRDAARRALALLRSPGACLSLLIPTDDPRSFTRKCFTWIAVGHIAGLLGAARR
jgi:glycosyltransferase involved in cell wall biosynthesis